MISVIAPTLNEVAHLRIFLNSLLNQNFKDFEVIIIDGGSTDGSRQLLLKYGMVLRLFTIVDRTRNFGFIRNLGAKYAKGDVMLHCNTDNYLPPNLLQEINNHYAHNSNLISLGGRIYPLGTSIIAHLAYQLFDFLRFAFTCFPMPIKKYRPSGNFMSIRSEVFREIGGHPEVRANEDALLGQKLDPYAAKNHKAVMFDLKLYVGHYVKKFESMGGIRAVLFYLYVFGNFFPMLKPMLQAILRNAEQVFAHSQPKQLSLRELLVGFWNWL